MHKRLAVLSFVLLACGNNEPRCDDVKCEDLCEKESIQCLLLCSMMQEGCKNEALPFIK